MTELKNTSFLPEKMQVLSGSVLKVIAMVVMLIDHGAFILLTQYPPAMRPLFTLGDTGYSREFDSYLNIKVL